MGFFKKANLWKATRVLQNAQQVRQLWESARRQAGKQKEQVGQAWGDMNTMGSMVKAYSQGKYRAVPFKSVLAAVGALLYFVNPWDLIPDFLIGGLLDDMMVLSAVLASLRADLEDYRSWQENPKRV